MLVRLNQFWQRYYAAITFAAFQIGVVLALVLSDHNLSDLLSLPPLVKAQTFYAALLAFFAAFISASALRFSSRHKEDRQDKRIQEERFENQKRAASILALYVKKKCIQPVFKEASYLMELALEEWKTAERKFVKPQRIDPESPRYPLIMLLPAEGAGYFFSFEETLDEIYQQYRDLYSELMLWQSGRVRHFERARNGVEQPWTPEQEKVNNANEIERFQRIKYEYRSAIMFLLTELTFFRFYLDYVADTGTRPAELETAKFRERASVAVKDLVPVPNTEISEFPF